MRPNTQLDAYLCSHLALWFILAITCCFASGTIWWKVPRCTEGLCSSTWTSSRCSCGRGQPSALVGCVCWGTLRTTWPQLMVMQKFQRGADHPGSLSHLVDAQYKEENRRELVNPVRRKCRYGGFVLPRACEHNTAGFSCSNSWQFLQFWHILILKPVIGFFGQQLGPINWGTHYFDLLWSSLILICYWITTSFLNGASGEAQASLSNVKHG